MVKKVKCSKCGYLCIEETTSIFLGDRKITSTWTMPQYDFKTHHLEVTPENRKDPSKLKSFADELFCYRHAFLLKEEVKSNKERTISKKIKGVIEKPRECEYHIKYIPGYDPARHLIRWENLQRETINRRWSLFYVLIGSIITILGALAIKLIFD